MSEYRLELTVKNNLIYERIEKLGYTSIKKFSEENGLPYHSIAKLIAMTLSPLNPSGEFRKCVNTLCNVLQCSPEDLFTQNQIHLELEKNKFITKVSEAELKYTLLNLHEPTDPILMLENKEREQEAINLLDTLTPREKKVLELRFGIESNEQMTLEECAKELDVTKERVRQIEAKSLRKLRHPSRHQYFKN